MKQLNLERLPRLAFEPGLHGSLYASQVVGPECVALGVILGIAINRPA